MAEVDVAPRLAGAQELPLTRHWLAAVLAAAALIPVVLLLTFGWFLREDRLREAETDVWQTVDILREHALRVFEAQEQMLARIDQRIANMDWAEIEASQDLHHFLADLRGRADHVNGLWLARPDGRTVNSADLFPFPDMDVLDRDYYAALRERDELFFGQVIEGKTKGNLNFNLSQRRGSPTEVFDGLVLLTVDLPYLVSFWQRVISGERGFGGVAGLFRQDGEILARYPALEEVPKQLAANSPLREAMATGDLGVYLDQSTIDGTQRIYGYARVGQYPVFVGYGVDRASVLAGWYDDLKMMGAVALTAALLLSAAVLLAWRQTRLQHFALISWRSTASELRDEIRRRERAEGTVAEKEALLAQVRRVTAERQAILDSMLEGVIAYGEDGRVIFSNAASTAILQLTGEGDPDLETFARDGRIRDLDQTPLSEEALPAPQILRGETVNGRELRIESRDRGRDIVCSFTGAALREDSGRVVGGVLTFQDVTERRAAEERQQLLMGELDHRVRNILATIQAMVSLSASRASSTAELVDTISGRISAMARTHGLLTRSGWKGASLRQLIADETQPYVGGKGLSLRLPGTKAGVEEDFLLPPKKALGLALVLHEMATNAAKYGAWSAEHGAVAITGKIVEGEEQCLRLEWREKNGPPVTGPSRKGFGSTLIGQALGSEVQGKVHLRFEPSGVECDIDLPLERLRRSTSPIGRDGEAAVLHLPAKMDRTRVLVVEDEAVVRLQLVLLLQQAGMEVVGEAASVSEATRMAADRQVDVGLLDVNLGGELVTPVAELLLQRGAAVVLISGYGRSDALPEELAQLPRLTKPVLAESVLRTVEKTLADNEVTQRVSRARG